MTSSIDPDWQEHIHGPAKEVVAPYLKRAQTRDKGQAGRVAEKKLAKRLGATQTPGSGSIAGAKADMRKAGFLIENKSTIKDSFSIRLEHLHKVYQEALEASMVPVLSFQFVNSQGQSEKRGRWVCISEAFFQELME